MKGGYILVVELADDEETQVGKLGLVLFPGGFYAYVGSAMKGLESRIARHLRQGKNLHWHIDYLLDKAKVSQIILCETAERVECLLAQALARVFPPVPGFGASDCRCQSHLFWVGKEQKVKVASVIAREGFVCREVYQVDKTRVEV